MRSRKGVDLEERGEKGKGGEGRRTGVEVGETIIYYMRYII